VYDSAYAIFVCIFSFLLVIFPALKVNGGQEEEDARVGRVLSPQLHAVLLGVLVVARLVLGVRQLGQTGDGHGQRDHPVARHGHQDDWGGTKGRQTWQKEDEDEDEDEEATSPSLFSFSSSSVSWRKRI
jgi:hypothetical protein